MRFKLLRIIFVLVTINILSGCGYTVLRDVGKEEMQAEWVAIDSMHFAPDLTIAKIDYVYLPPNVPEHFIDPIDAHGTAMVRFHLTIENLGNADFHEPYTVVFIKENPRPTEFNTFYSTEFNKHRDTIPVHGRQVINFVNMYPFYKSSYTFVIVTNPIIQNEVVEALRYHTHPQAIHLTRESRYDNNSARITLPPLEELLYGAQQGK